MTLYAGINYNGMHDSSAAAVDADGDVVAAVSEERLSRVKQDGRFPHAAIAMLDWDRVEAVGVPYVPGDIPPCATEPGMGRAHEPGGAIVNPCPPLWRERIAAIDRPVHFFDHHEMHAMTAHVLSGQPETLALTADYGAHGCPVTMGLYAIGPAGSERLAGVAAHEYEALAALYSDVTALLGFVPCRHEGKIMGLAGRGRPDPACRTLLLDVHREIRRSPVRLYDWIGYLDETVPPLFEPNAHLVRQFRSRLPFDDATIARAAQDELEERLTAIGDWIRSVHGTARPLVLAGGVFSNVAANALWPRLGFSSVFVAPPMGDEGLSVGAAAAARRLVTGPRPRAAATGPVGMALGRPVEPAPEHRLRQLGLRWERPERLDVYVAERLAQGAAVAVVRGREEFGPRALGHRSVLLSPTDPDRAQDLNDRFGRSEFMPFAPVMAARNVEKLLDLDEFTEAALAGCLPFMTVSVPVREGVADVAPAVVHVDGSVRPQVVDADDDPFLHGVLAVHEALTGVGMLINTSFNLHEEPIVSTAADAVRTFLLAGIDVLVLEDLVIEAHANPHAAAVAELAGSSPAARTEKLRRHAVNLAFGRQIVDGPQRFSMPPD